jgi:predicted metalloprotease
MRWQDAERSSNVDDVRGQRFGGGGMPLRLGGMGGMSLGGLVAIMAITYLLGGDPLAILTGGTSTETSAPPSAANSTPVDDEGSRFVGAVLKSTETVWATVFREQLGKTYTDPRLVMFSDAVPSACGTNSSAVGPFYCPPDQRVYIDISFYQELDRRFGAPGDFAQAYVIAHEVGHHVQNLLGTSDKVTQLQQRASESQSNQLSVRLELQADCYAGVWGYYAKQKDMLDPGDLEEALGAASAIGDDRLQREAQGYVVPDSFTHGSSEQRVRWFRAGFDSGDVRRCDTFGSRGI